MKYIKRKIFYSSWDTILKYMYIEFWSYWLLCFHDNFGKCVLWKIIIASGVKDDPDFEHRLVLSLTCLVYISVNIVV